MTNPALSISTTKQIGRLYQLPGGTYAKSISSTAAKRGLYEARDLFPSITNVLNVLNKDLQGYTTFMIGKALREGQAVPDALQAADIYRDHASARGSAVHNLIEEYINAGNGKRGMFLPAFKSLPGWPEVQELGGEGYMRGFIRFANDYQPQFLQQEATVYGSTSKLGAAPNEAAPSLFNYAGTTDFIANINGVKVVGDWKCTSKLHGTVARQMAAVRNASHFYDAVADSLAPWDGASIEHAIAVRLCSDGSYEVQSANLDAGWKSFQLLREEWDNFAFGDSDMLRALPLMELA